jgi:hypothetical protein
MCRRSGRSSTREISTSSARILRGRVAGLDNRQAYVGGLGAGVHVKVYLLQRKFLGAVLRWRDSLPFLFTGRHQFVFDSEPLG